MIGSYTPSCPACRTQDHTSFHRSCNGCQARKAHLDAQRREDAPLTPDQVAGMDSTIQQLEAERPTR